MAPWHNVTGAIRVKLVLDISEDLSREKKNLVLNITDAHKWHLVIQDWNCPARTSDLVLLELWNTCGSIWNPRSQNSKVSHNCSSKMLWGQLSVYSFSQHWNWTCHYSSVVVFRRPPTKMRYAFTSTSGCDRRSQLWHATKQPFDSF